MWWRDVRDLDGQVSLLVGQEPAGVARSARIDPRAEIDESLGPVVIGAGTRVCAGAVIRGPAVIGDHCLIGNGAFIRGPVWIGSHVTIGYGTEVKQAIIGGRSSLGPLCFVADSRIDEGAYLGALVRTSNQRLDRRAVSVEEDGKLVATGMDKLGCWIQSGASLGIQVIILPGRVIAAGTTLEPRITVTRNLPRGHYRVSQTLERVA